MKGCGFLYRMWRTGGTYKKTDFGPTCFICVYVNVIKFYVIISKWVMTYLMSVLVLFGTFLA